MIYIILLFSIIVNYVHAAYYILDVVKYSDSILFNGQLHYQQGSSLIYSECKGLTSMFIKQNQLGGSIKCEGIKTSMGLYFPNGYNGTINAAYDYYGKTFYPCVEINRENSIFSYGCGNVMVEFDDIVSTTTTTITSTTTSVILTTATTPITSNTITNPPTPIISSNVLSSSCVPGAYGKKRGVGKSGQCFKTNDDCLENCENGICGKYDVDFKC